jgi:hypothetical protein
MGTTLTGTTPQDTYDSLIKVTDNGPISGTLKALSDGLGNDSTLSLSTTAASIAGTLAVTGNATFDTNTLFVDATNNRVAVGTAATTYKLEAAVTDATAYSSANTLTASPVFWVNNNSTTAGTAATIRLDGGALGGNAAATISSVHVASGSSALTFGTRSANSDITERMRITATGNVGIGVTPSAWGTNDKAIELGGSNSSTYTGLNVTSLAKNCYYDGTNWVYEQSAVTSLLYQQSFTGNHIFYTAPTGTAGAAITFTEAVRIDSNGIKFNGDTAAANALDDYEEGTWTPVILGDTGGVVTLVTQFGKYTKIGNMVTLNGYVSWSVNTGAGQARLTGLPFAINNTTTPIANQVAIHEQNGGVAQGVHFRFDGTAAAAQGYSYNFDGTAATCLSFGATGYIGINATYFV